MNLSYPKLSEALAKRSEVMLTYLFGSQAKRKASKKSDVDIAILLKEPILDPLTTKLELINALQSQISEDIDITILNEAGSVLKYQVVKNGKLLFERQKGMHKKFQIAAWKEYFDFQPTLNFFYQRKIA